MGNLSEAIERLQPPLRVEAFNHIEAGKADFMAMIVRDPEPGVAEILGQQMQDQTAEDICLVVNEAADELTALREALTTARQALGDIAYVHETAGAMREKARAALSAAIGEGIGGGRG